MDKTDFCKTMLIQTGRWCVVAVVVSCVTLLCGCANFNLGGEKFQYDPAFEMGPKLRPVDNSTEPVAVSNKSLQIEKNLGIQ